MTSEAIDVDGEFIDGRHAEAFSDAERPKWQIRCKMGSEYMVHSFKHAFFDHEFGSARRCFFCRLEKP